MHLLPGLKDKDDIPELLFRGGCALVEAHLLQLAQRDRAELRVGGGFNLPVHDNAIPVDRYPHHDAATFPEFGVFWRKGDNTAAIQGMGYAASAIAGRS